MSRRILLLITDLEIGGTPTVVRELAIRLNDPPNVQVEVACLKKWGPVADQLRDAGIRVSAFNASRAWRLPATVRKLRGLIGARGIDTVFSFLMHANAVAALASRRLPGVRFIQSIQTIQPHPRWHWWVQSHIHESAEAVVGPSLAVARAARELANVPVDKCIIIPNAIDPSDFPRIDVFAGTGIRAGYLGRLDPMKSPGLLIDALRSAAMPDATLHYFGDGAARPGLERTAARAGLIDRIIFHGTVARPQDALAQIDVLWMPSRVEGFGLVLIEAMASGVPVVAFNAGGVSDIVTDEENGIVSDEDSAVFRFAASLGILRDDPTLRDKLIENGLRTVKEKFTWEVVLPQYRRLLGVH